MFANEHAKVRGLLVSRLALLALLLLVLPACVGPQPTPAAEPSPTAVAATGDTPTPAPALLAPAVERKPSDVVVEFADDSVARYRVKEELANVSVPGDAVGETPDVVGAIVFSADG